jgi:hypothetical protein
VKRKVAWLSFIMALLLSATGLMLVNLATANPFWGIPTYLPYATIQSDGSITPETQYIKRDGSVYTLTADVEEYPINIECSDIVFDGSGHTITITEGNNSGVLLSGVSNVTVKNLKVQSSSSSAVYLKSCFDCLVTGIKTSNSITLEKSKFNTVMECVSGIALMSETESNKIVRNNITDIFAGASFFNYIYQNNILCKYVPAKYFSTSNYWDNSSMGNFWSDYFIKYPNASEIDNTGIGDTPYLIDAENVDNYPFMYTFDTENGSIAFPESETELFPVALAVGASGASIAIVAIWMRYYQKKRKP